MLFHFTKWLDNTLYPGHKLKNKQQKNKKKFWNETKKKLKFLQRLKEKNEYQKLKVAIQTKKFDGNIITLLLSNHWPYF